jgi:hypothetical protein
LTVHVCYALATHSAKMKVTYHNFASGFGRVHCGVEAQPRRCDVCTWQGHCIGKDQRGLLQAQVEPNVNRGNRGNGALSKALSESRVSVKIHDPHGNILQYVAAGCVHTCLTYLVVNFTLSEKDSLANMSCVCFGT